MQQTINALNVEIQSLRVRLAAAEADANASRQELLAIRARQDHIQSSINHMTLNFAFGTHGSAPVPMMATSWCAPRKTHCR